MKKLTRLYLLYLRWLYAVRIDRYERLVVYWKERRMEVLHRLAKGDE